MCVSMVKYIRRQRSGDKSALKRSSPVVSVRRQVGKRAGKAKSAINGKKEAKRSSVVM